MTRLQGKCSYIRAEYTKEMEEIQSVESLFSINPPDEKEEMIQRWSSVKYP